MCARKYAFPVLSPQEFFELHSNGCVYCRCLRLTGALSIYASMKNRTQGGTVLQKPSRKPHKKECDLGRTCPYQEEYQHLLEFSHECAPSGRNAPSRANNHAFMGSGHRLGGTAETSWNRNIPKMWEDSIRCEICSAKVSIERLAVHLSQHENNGKSNTLKVEQDNALEESILFDIQRLSEVESARQNERARERAAAEKREYEEALAISISESHKADRESATRNLLPEPDDSYTEGKVVLKFILSDSNKLVRTFRANNPVQDAFCFLRTQEVLEGKQFLLRNAINTLNLEAGDSRSFVQAGVPTNSSLLVVVIAAADPTPAVPTTSLVTSSTSSSSSSSISSNSNCDSNRNSGSGMGRGTLKRSHSDLEHSRSSGTGAEAVVDLLSPQPLGKVTLSTRREGGIAAEAGASGLVVSGQSLRTPHRSTDHSDSAAVIDLTLS